MDIYENIVHVAEYARDHGMEPDEHAEWLEGCLEVISEVTGVHTDSIYLKFRQRQKGLRQYERFDRTGAEFLVRENGLRFAIRPADYLDVGLFLDHRNTRQMVREQSAEACAQPLRLHWRVHGVRRRRGRSRYADGGHEQHLPTMG